MVTDDETTYFINHPVSFDYPFDQLELYCSISPNTVRCESNQTDRERRIGGRIPDRMANL